MGARAGRRRLGPYRYQEGGRDRHPFRGRGRHDPRRLRRRGHERGPWSAGRRAGGDEHERPGAGTTTTTSLMGYCVAQAKTLYERRPDIAVGKDPVARCQKMLTEGVVDQAGVDEAVRFSEAAYGPAPGATTTTTTTSDKPKTWVEVASISATAAKRGTPFQLVGGQQRVTYSCIGEGTGCMWDVRGPDRDCYAVAKAGVSDQTQCYLEAGEYHLELDGFSRCTLTVKLEELQ